MVSADFVSNLRSKALANGLGHFVGNADSIALPRCRYYEHLTINSWSSNRHLLTVKLIQPSHLHFSAVPNCWNSILPCQCTLLWLSSSSRYSSPNLTGHFFQQLHQVLWVATSFRCQYCSCTSSSDFVSSTAPELWLAEGSHCLCSMTSSDSSSINGFGLIGYYNCWYHYN